MRKFIFLMMIRFCAYQLLIFFPFYLFAGNENYQIGARSSGMANASVATSDFWSVYNNQAGIANLKNISAGFYIENKFLMPSMGLKSLAVVIPTNSGNLGLSFNHYGYSLYNEQKIGLAFGKKLHEKFALGVQLDYLSTTIQEYGSKKNLTFEAGILATITNHIHLGAHVYNPIHSKLSGNELYDERIPSIIRMGIEYKFSEKVLVSIEAEKDIYFKPVFKSGVEYHVVEIFYLRAGISTNPTLNTFGFGLDYKGWKLDVASSYHQALGITPQFSLIYEFRKVHKVESL